MKPTYKYSLYKYLSQKDDKGLEKENLDTLFLKKSYNLTPHLLSEHCCHKFYDIEHFLCSL